MTNSPSEISITKLIYSESSVVNKKSVMVDKIKDCNSSDKICADGLAEGKEKLATLLNSPVNPLMILFITSSIFLLSGVMSEFQPQNLAFAQSEFNSTDEDLSKESKNSSLFSGSDNSTLNGVIDAQSIDEVNGDFNADGFDDIAIGVPLEDVVTTEGTITDAGAINVLYGSSHGLSATSPQIDQFWTQETSNVQDSSETGDLFGSSLSSGDFNADGFDDIAIGVPRESIATANSTVNITNAGAINVLYGSSNGLSATSPIPDQFWTQKTSNVQDSSETGDLFGSALSSGDFNADGFDDIAIGIEFENLVSNLSGSSTSNGTGAINVLYGSSNGLSASPIPDQFWTQKTSNVQDSSERGDLFGSALSSGDFNADGFDDIAIGVPLESIATPNSTVNITNAGANNVLYGSSNGLSATSPIPNQFWTQDSANIADSPESNDVFASSLFSGDFNADGFDDIAIGVPQEDVVTTEGTFTDAGAINVLYGSSNGLSATSPIPDQFWTQETSNVQDSSETGDLFGSSLSSGDFNADGFDDIAIGVPLESIATANSTVNITNAGAINVLYGSSNGLSATSPIPDQFWTQDSANITDSPESNDVFASSLFSGDFNADGFDDIAIGVPQEGLETVNKTVNMSGIANVTATANSTVNITNAGAINVLYGSSNGLSATSPIPNQFWTQDTPRIEGDPEVKDKFGSIVE